MYGMIVPTSIKTSFCCGEIKKCTNFIYSKYVLLYILIYLKYIYMHVLLTGADGLLGSNLVPLLLQRGHKVRVFLFPASNSKSLEGLDIEKVYGNILDPHTLEPAFEGCDAVIHAAALTNIWPARSVKVRQVNIEGTRNVVQASINSGIKRMIYVGSGSSVNAQPDKDSKYDFPGAKFGLDYIDSKYEALNLVLDAVKNQNLPAIAVLPTFMIGAYDSLPGSGQMILAVAQGKMKFYTCGGRNYVHVMDVATAIANGLEKGTIGKYYIAGNENLTYKEFLSKTAEIVNKPKPFLQVPGWLVKAFGYLGTVFGTWLGKQPMISYPLACISCEKQYVSSKDAVNELLMPQTDISVAISDCYQWFVENNYLNKKK